MHFDVSDLTQSAAYKLLIGSIVPRPIAWVSSCGADGCLNIAPFSFFTAVSASPPMIAISVANDRRNGMKKDTLLNIEQSSEFVVNIVSEELADQMNTTGTEFGPEEDEFALAGLTPLDSLYVKPPRIAESPISMECRIDRFVPIGHAPHILVIAEVLCFHIRDEIYDAATGRIDMAGLRPIARMAGHLYTKSDIFQMQRKEADYRG